MIDKAKTINDLSGKGQAYKSPFSEGLEAASNGTPWTRCPYLGKNQSHERNEWLRGHSCKELLS